MKNITKNQNRFTCPETDRVSSTNSKSEQEIHPIDPNCNMEFVNSSNNLFFKKERGFPTKCLCGSDVVKYTSESIDNPGRPYFRCAVSRKDKYILTTHYDAIYDEVQDLIQKCGRRESGRRESEGDHGRMIEVNELMVEILNVKEEVLQCRNEIHKFKIKNLVVLVLCLGVLAFVIIYHIMFHKANGNTFAIGNM